MLLKSVIKREIEGYRFREKFRGQSNHPVANEGAVFIIVLWNILYNGIV